MPYPAANIVCPVLLLILLLTLLAPSWHCPLNLAVKVVCPALLEILKMACPILVLSTRRPCSECLSNPPGNAACLNQLLKLFAVCCYLPYPAVKVAGKTLLLRLLAKFLAKPCCYGYWQNPTTKVAGQTPPLRLLAKPRP